MSENKTITSLNQLKNWFKTGLKPTQAQFWAWLDSFYHKDEEIPQDKISGLAETLENKAETSDLEAKANADASGLSDDEKEAWKEALGVGELPINIATIDQAEEQGNVYTKEQTNTLLENSGKNLGNTDLRTTGVRTFTQGYNFTHHTAGFYYYLTGLADKSSDATFSQMLVEDTNGQVAKSNGKAVLESLMSGLRNTKILTPTGQPTGEYESGFNQYLVFNPNTNQLAKTDKPQIVTNFNVPTNISLNHVTNVANVNWQPHPNYPQEVLEMLNFIKTVENLGFTKVKKSEFVLRTISPTLFPKEMSDYTFPNRLFEFPIDGQIIFNSYNNRNLQNWRWTEFWTSMEQLGKMQEAGQTAIFNLFINKELPINKDWVVRMKKLHEGWNLATDSMDIAFSNEIEALPTNNDAHKIAYFTANEVLANYNVPFQNIYIIKKGNVLAYFTQDTFSNGAITLKLIPYDENMKFIKIQDSGRSSHSTDKRFSFSNISYWIQL